MIDLSGPAVEGWVSASIHELIDGAPGAEVLGLGVELSILEGPREVARMMIDTEQESWSE